MAKKTLLIDLTAVAAVEGDKLTELCHGAAEAIAELRKNGYVVNVCSRSGIATSDVESFLREKGVEFDAVSSVPSFDMFVGFDAIRASDDWKWTLENIVMHRPRPEKEDLKAEMHKSMENYKKWAKDAKNCCCG